MNEFTLTGRVNFIDIKYTESCKCFTRVLLSQKQKNGEYETYPITVFNTNKANTAEDLAEEVKKGDYIEITGKLTVEKFKTKTGEDVERIGLIGFGYDKIVWDESKGKYVKVPKGRTENEKFSEVEKTPPDNMFVKPRQMDLMDY